MDKTSYELTDFINFNSLFIKVNSLCPSVITHLKEYLLR